MAEAAAAPISVLLVEDNREFARLVTVTLARTEHGAYVVEHCDSLARAAGRLSEREFDLILLDLALPDSAGLETLDAIQAAIRGAAVVVLTGTADDALGHEAVRRGAQDFLIKGEADDRLLVRAIQHAVERRRILEERDDLIGQLQVALEKVKQLSGLLPICSFCKQIRDDRGYWQQIEEYIGEHSEAEFSHGLCPACAAKHYPELSDEPAVAPSAATTEHQPPHRGT